MLTELRIRNFAIIESLELACGPGLHVLTGETGAGKSIIVDALGLLCGWRAGTDVIRSGCDEAVLEARLEPPDLKDVRRRLAAIGVEPLPERAILLRRVIARGDRGRVSINGQMATVSQLAHLCAGLIHIHGQSDQYALLSPAEQLELLDRYGGLGPLRDDYAARYARYHALHQELTALESTERDSAQRAELLEFQLTELDGAQLQDGEEERLGEEQGRLRYAAQLAEAAEESYQLLYDGDASMAQQAARVRKLAEKMAQIDASMDPALPLLDDVSIRLQELARLIRDYKERLVHDPDRLAEVEDRLALLARLKKKHGGAGVPELLQRAAALREEWDRLAHRDERLASIAAETAAAAAQLNQSAEKLSSARRKSAEKFCRQVERELAQVRMTQASCAMACTPMGPPHYQADGWDRIEFLVTANRGEALKALRKVASGGELSRLMLAILSVLGDADRVPVLVFDEIDAGIGGAVAELVG
ncbi:MAG: DNA repair protein RecN, partial [Nitrospirota bacterium]